MINVQESKQLFFDFLRKDCEEFKHAKFLFNNMFVTMRNQKYFTLKFNNEEVELHEREYFNDGSKKTHLLKVFSLSPTKDQLVFMRERFLQ